MVFSEIPTVRCPCTLECPRIGADAGAGLADVSAQQQQIDDHLHRLDAVLMLGDAHSVTGDHGIRPHVDVGRIGHGRLAESGSTLQIAPTPAAGRNAANFSKPDVCCSMKPVSTIRGPTRCFGGIIGLDDELADADHRGRIAADADLMILRAHVGAARHHLDRALRVGENAPARVPAAD